MNRSVSLGILGIVMSLLFACSPSPAIIPDAQDPASIPLSEPGPYFAGDRSLTLVDESRDGREVGVTIWYPAIKENDANGYLIRHDAAADISDAPYPFGSFWCPYVHIKGYPGVRYNFFKYPCKLKTQNYKEHNI